VAQGLAVYRAQYCGLCHELSSADIGGLLGPTHDGVGSVAAERIQAPGYRGSATTAAEYLRESIVAPQAYFVPGYEASSQPMPAYSHLSEEEVLALVQLLLAQE
jgi:nitric oxide reductase subunit C